MVQRSRKKLRPPIVDPAPMGTRRLLRGAALTLVGWLCGCAGLLSDPPSLERSPVSLELTHTPYFPQVTDQCGPAALASILVHAGVETNALRLRDQVYVPELGGSLQPELIAAVRRHGLVPYVTSADPGGLLDQLADGSPVIVLQNLGVGPFSAWHYAVAIGYDAEADAVILRSGSQPRLKSPRHLFNRTWRRGNFWTLSVFAPEHIPMRADRRAVLSALAAIEEAGLFALAHRGYREVVQRWPAEPFAHLGMANTHFRLGRPAAALTAYDAVLRLDPNLRAAQANRAHVCSDIVSNGTDAQRTMVAPLCAEAAN